MRNTILVLVLLSSTIAIPFLPSLVPPNMRTASLLLLSLSAAASAIFLLPRFHTPSTPTSVVVHSQGPTVEKLERLSSLVTTRVQVADILVAEGKGCRGSWLIKGNALQDSLYLSAAPPAAVANRTKITRDLRLPPAEAASIGTFL